MIFVLIFFVIACFSLGFTMSELALPRRRQPSAWLPAFTCLLCLGTFGLSIYPEREEFLIAPILFGATLGFYWIPLNRYIQVRTPIDYWPYTPYVTGVLLTIGYTGLFTVPAVFQPMVYLSTLIGAVYLIWTRLVRPLADQPRRSS